MLLNPKHKKKVQMAWAILSFLVVLSMILLYAQGLLPN
jgi:hypothetical protein